LKTLLPYFRENLYRQISLCSFISLARLSRTVQAVPFLGTLVETLDVSRVTYTSEAYETLRILLNALPSLKSLKTFEIDSLSSLFRYSLPPLLPKLESISYYCDELSYADLDFATRFINLKRIAIRVNYSQVETSELVLDSLDNIQELSITLRCSDEIEYTPWTASMARFVDRFPQLCHLILLAEIYPEYSDILRHLDLVATSLTSLTLLALPPEDFFDSECDHHLPRFVNLERLDLGQGTASPALPLFLRLLPRLHFLRLGEHTQWQGPNPATLRSLVEGPQRLVTLRTFVLMSLIVNDMGRSKEEKKRARRSLSR